MEIIYRVFTPDKGLHVDFESAEEAETFRDTEYHGPIVIIEDGEEIEHY